MKESVIEHIGVVENIQSHRVVVAILQESACASCAAASLCHSAEQQVKKMEVYVANPADYSEGQQVVVVGRLGLGLQAVLWSYVVPLVLMMAVLLLVFRLTQHEGLAALVSIASLLPYYGVLYLQRHRLQKKFQFYLK